jgi:hypothetical protein
MSQHAYIVCQKGVGTLQHATTAILVYVNAFNESTASLKQLQFT